MIRYFGLLLLLCVLTCHSIGQIEDVKRVSSETMTDYIKSIMAAVSHQKNTNIEALLSQVDSISNTLKSLNKENGEYLLDKKELNQLHNLMSFISENQLSGVCSLNCLNLFIADINIVYMANDVKPNNNYNQSQLEFIRDTIYQVASVPVNVQQTLITDMCNLYYKLETCLKNCKDDVSGQAILFATSQFRYLCGERKDDYIKGWPCLLKLFVPAANGTRKYNCSVTANIIRSLADNRTTEDIFADNKSIEDHLRNICSATQRHLECIEEMLKKECGDEALTIFNDWSQKRVGYARWSLNLLNVDMPSECENFINAINKTAFNQTLVVNSAQSFPNTTSMNSAISSTPYNFQEVVFSKNSKFNQHAKILNEILDSDTFRRTDNKQRLKRVNDAMEGVVDSEINSQPRWPSFNLWTGDNFKSMSSSAFRMKSFFSFV